SPFAQSFRTLVSSQADVIWVGYATKAVDSERVMCCVNSGTTWINGDLIMTDRSSCCGACRLEPSSDATTGTRSQAPGGPIKLEGSDRMLVLYRVAERRVDRIRVFSDDCQLDAGGRPVRWIENVGAADSVALLESYVTGGDIDRSSRVMDGAI